MSVDDSDKPRKLDPPQWEDVSPGLKRDENAMFREELQLDPGVTTRRRDAITLRKPDSATPFRDSTLADYYRLASQALADHGHVLVDDGNNIEGNHVDLNKCPQTCVVANRLRGVLATLLRFERGQPVLSGTRDEWLLSAGRNYGWLESLLHSAIHARSGKRKSQIGRGAAEKTNKSQRDLSDDAAREYLDRLTDTCDRLDAVRIRDEVADDLNIGDRKTIERALKRLAGTKVGRKVRGLPEAHRILGHPLR